MAETLSVTSTTVRDDNYYADLQKDGLSNTDFIQLLVTQLQLQDPTKPMDSNEMLNTTMQMSTIEANQANVAAMEAVSNAMTQSQFMNGVNLVGRNVKTAEGDFAVTSLQFSDGNIVVKSGDIEIAFDEIEEIY